MINYKNKYKIRYLRMKRRKRIATGVGIACGGAFGILLVPAIVFAGPGDNKEEAVDIVHTETVIDDEVVSIEATSVVEEPVETETEVIIEETKETVEETVEEEPIVEETVEALDIEVVLPEFETEVQTESFIEESDLSGLGVQEVYSGNKVSFKDIRQDFWFSDDGLHTGGLGSIPAGLEMPELDVKDFQYLKGVNDSNWLQYAVSINSVYYKYYGEMACIIDDNGDYWYDGATNADILSKNRWTEERILNTVKNIVYRDMSEQDAVNAIRDYIRNSFSASDSATGSMYELWSTGVGNCESYSRTFKEMCNFVGIRCQYVEGIANGLHAWNRVCIDGNWYWTDVTWYDSSDEIYRSSVDLWSDHEATVVV